MTDDLQRQLVHDLHDETAALLAMLEPLRPQDWSTLTPATPWTVLDQVTHLAAFDERQTMAITDPEGFSTQAAKELASTRNLVDAVRDDFASMEPSAVFSWFSSVRATMVEALASTPPSTRIGWYGPSMGPVSALTARLMETWAHGYDIADALGVTPAPTARLRHIAELAYRARSFAFSAHDVAMPEAPLRFELTAPDGSTWTIGDDAAVAVVSGPALDLCLLAVQRRHHDDLDLEASNADAASWLAVAQAFAGPAGPGRAARRNP